MSNNNSGQKPKPTPPSNTREKSENNSPALSNKAQK